MGLLAVTTFACSDAANEADDDAGLSSSSGDTNPAIEAGGNNGDSGGVATDSGNSKDATSHADAGRADSGHADSGHGDSGAEDAGITDSGSKDSGNHDSGFVDSGVKDAGPPDTGTPDSGGGGGYDGGLSPLTCIERLDTQYMIRNDGALLFDDGKTPVTDATTGLPLTNVTSAADGAYHGCALTSDGRAVCWRLRTDTFANGAGQLGNGTTGDTGSLYRATQVLVSAGKPLTNVAKMASGTADEEGVNYGHSTSSCAITADGKAYCWGNLGWLVNGGTYVASAYAQPITVDGATPLTGIKQLAYTTAYACAVVQNGPGTEVWCWGQNNNYNLGQGDQVNQQYPKKVLGLIKPTQVAIANTYSNDGTTCAIDGANVKCWGGNNGGACGNDSTADYCTNPVTVLGPTGLAFDGATQIVGGGNSQTFCVLRGNTVWCWGVGNAKHAGTLGVPNVVGLASAGVLTDDGSFHPFPISSGKTVTPFCGTL